MREKVVTEVVKNGCSYIISQKLITKDAQGYSDENVTMNDWTYQTRYAHLSWKILQNLA